MSIEIKRLLNRHTVKTFTEEKLSPELIENALKIARRTPTSLNSKPVQIFEITKHLKDEWLNHQVPVQTATHLFALTFSSETAEKNIRKGFAEKFGCECNDEKIENLLDQYVRPGGDHYPELQLYLTAGYFSASIEMMGGSGCWIRGFDPTVAKKELNIPKHETVGLLFAAGIEK